MKNEGEKERRREGERERERESDGEMDGVRKSELLVTFGIIYQSCITY